MKTALIVVDLQNDFLPGGALGAPNGDLIIPYVNSVMDDYDLVVASRDWHPVEHGSFATNHSRKVGELIELEGLQQILWPVHCVQETPGAEFAPGLRTDRIDKIVNKGTQKTVDSYSCFFDNARRHSTGLSEYLQQQGVEEIAMVGIATDYCVKFSVLDAIDEGFKTHVLVRGCAGIDLSPGDSEAALQLMEEAGADLVR